MTTASLYRDTIAEARKVSDLPFTSPDFKYAWNALEDRLLALDEASQVDLADRARTEKLHKQAALVILGMLE